MLTQTNLTSHLPRTTGKVTLQGLLAPAQVYRDAWGIPHAQAANETDAFYVQGFVTAQDRLWQMEYDRRRGSGRWAEMVGELGLDQDIVMRRFRLVDSAQADYGAVNDHTRQLMDSYAAGVNAWIATATAEGTLPVEYSITGLSPNMGPNPGNPGMAWWSSRCAISSWASSSPKPGAPSWSTNWARKRRPNWPPDTSLANSRSCPRAVATMPNWTITWPN